MLSFTITAMLASAMLSSQPTTAVSTDEAIAPQPPQPASIREIRLASPPRVAMAAGMQRGRLGIVFGMVDAPLALHLGLDPEHVILIEHVVEEGAAAEAGVQMYDIITHIDGEAPATRDRLRAVVMQKEQGDVLSLTLLRAGESRDVSIEMKQRPVDPEVAAEARNRQREVSQHVELLARELNELLHSQERIREGSEENVRKIRELIRRRLMQEEEFKEARSNYENLHQRFRQAFPSAAVVELQREGDDVQMLYRPAQPGGGGIGRPGPGVRGGMGGGAGGHGGFASPSQAQQEAQIERMQQRIQEVDQRLERIEQMLRRLIERE